MHKELHPSPLTKFPSSQYVVIELYLIPSPQISTQISFEVVEPPDQFHPDSVPHDELHPSPFEVLPSSQ